MRMDVRKGKLRHRAFTGIPLDPSGMTGREIFRSLFLVHQESYRQRMTRA